MNSTTCTTIEKARQALDLAADADWSQIRRSYRDMVKVWHPDRFQHDKELCERARRMTVEINLAYEQLEAMREKGESVSKDPRDCAAEKPSCNFRRAGASNNRRTAARPCHTSKILMALNIILWPVLFPARCAASIVLFLSSEWRIETLLICMFLVFSVNFQRQNDWAGCSLVYRIAQVKANAEYHCRTLLNKALQAPVSVMQRRACLAEALKRRATR